MQSVIFKDLMENLGRWLNMLPFSPAGTAITTATALAATEVTSSVRELEKPDDDQIFRQFNQNLAITILEVEKEIPHDQESTLNRQIEKNTPDYGNFISSILRATLLKGVTIEERVELIRFIIDNYPPNLVAKFNREQRIKIEKLKKEKELVEAEITRTEAEITRTEVKLEIMTQEEIATMRQRLLFFKKLKEEDKFTQEYQEEEQAILLAINKEEKIINSCLQSQS